MIYLMAKKMNRTTIIIILFIVLCPAMSLIAKADSSHEKITILLKERLKARGDIILLGDIAHIEGTNTALIEQLKQTPLGKSPSPGYNKPIMPQNILYQLKKNHWDYKNFSFSGPRRCLVERHYREMSTKEVENCFVDLFYEKYSQEEFELDSVQARLPENIKIPEGNTEFEILFSRPPTQQEENFALQIKQDGKLIKKIWISARLHYHTTVLMALRDIPRGQKITLDDVSPQKKLMNHRDDEHIWDISQAAGLISRQFIRAGTVLSLHMLKKPQLIKKGAIIKMVAENENIRVVSLGKAMANGYQGEIIPAQNLASQKNVYGEVIGENQIRIHF